MQTEKQRTSSDGLRRETQRRLYRLPQLIQRIAFNRHEIKKIEDGEIASTSRSIVLSDGIRCSRINAADAKLALLNAYLKTDSAEVAKMKWALRNIRNDSYYPLIEYKYFRKMSDDETAEKLNCNPSTVRRNNARIINTLTDLLYGANEKLEICTANIRAKRVKTKGVRIDASC